MSIHRCIELNHTVRYYWSSGYAKQIKNEHLDIELRGIHENTDRNRLYI